MFHLILFFLLVFSIAYRVVHKKEVKVEEVNLKTVLPCAERFQKKKNYWLGYKGNEVCGVAFLTPHVPPKVKGYADEIWLLAGVDPKGEITGIEVIWHNETPFYFEMLEEAGLFQDIKEHNIKEGFKGLTAVSGATISSRAVINDVIRGAVYVAKKEFGIEVKLGDKKNIRELIYGIGTFLLFTLASLSVILKKKMLSYISFFFSFFFLGILLNNVFSLSDVSKIMLFRFPGASNLSLFLLYLMVILSSLLPRPAYCWGVCPYGALQELVSVAGRKGKVVDAKTAMLARRVREVLTVLLLASFFLSGLSAFVSVEPFHWMFSGSGSIVMWIFAIAGILLSVLIYRFWCIFICPTGTVLETISGLFNRLLALLSRPRRS